MLGPVVIPFFSLEGRRAETGLEVLKAIERVHSSDVFVGGEEVAKFELEFAQFTGLTNFVGVGNGLDALRIGLQASGIGPGDEVIVPAFTFVATWLAVLQTGACPVGVDVDQRTANILPAAVEAAVTPRTAGIVGVNLFGRAAEWTALGQIANRYGLLLAEDAAQSHGLEGSHTGSARIPNFTAYSFYPTKNLGGIGDAGGIGANSNELTETARLMRNYGASPSDKYRHVVPGLNSRLDPVQAAALRVFLHRLSDWNLRRRVLAQRYLECMSDVSQDTVRPLDESLRTEDSVWHHFVVVAPQRDQFRSQMRSRGVGTEIHYPKVAAHAPAVLSEPPPVGEFPISEFLAEFVVSLPMHPWIGSCQQDFIVDQLAELGQTRATLSR